MKNKFIQLVKKFISHELVSGSFYVFLGSMINNVFSFLFNLFLVRKFTTSDYGIYASLVSLITLSSFFSQSLITVLVKFSSDFIAKQKIAQAAAFYKKLLKHLIIFALGVFIVFVVSLTLIKNFLHIDNTFFILLVAIIASVAYVSMINEAFIRSLLKFKYLSFLFSLGSIGKLMVGAILIILGFGIYGALGAILFNGLVILILGFIPLKFLFNQKAVDGNFSKNGILRYAIPASITVLFLASFVSTDIILVKHFLSSSQAGLYGGLSLVGKVIFYFTSPIPLVMFPLIIKRYTQKISFHSLYYLSLLLVSLASVIIVAFYFAFPKFVINLFLGGENYYFVTPYIGLFAIFLSLYSLVNVCVNFFLSIGKTGIYKLVVPLAILQILLILFFHGNFTEIILSSIASISLLLVSLLLYYYLEFYGIYHAQK